MQARPLPACTLTPTYAAKIVALITLVLCLSKYLKRRNRPSLKWKVMPYSRFFFRCVAGLQIFFFFNNSTSMTARGKCLFVGFGFSILHL